MDLTKRGKPENKKRFKELFNRYPAEPEHKPTRKLNSWLNTILMHSAISSQVCVNITWNV